MKRLYLQGALMMLLFFIGNHLNAQSEYDNTFCIDSINYRILSDTTVETWHMRDDSLDQGGAVNWMYYYDNHPLTIPEKVSHEGIEYTVVGIGKYSFDQYYTLPRITFPNTIKYIKEYAFRYCSALHFQLPPNVERIESQAFYRGGSGLADTILYIPASVSYIAPGAFAGRCNIVHFEVDTGNAYYAGYNGAIYTKDYSTLVAYPTNLGGDTIFRLHPNTRYITSYAFYCSGVDSVVFPDSLLYIGEHAFTHNLSLRGIHLPAHVRMENNPFHGSYNLKYISVDENNPYYEVDTTGDYHTLYSKTGDTLWMMALKNAARVRIPSRAKVIGYSALAHEENIHVYEVPEGVVTLMDSALACCYRLDSVYLPNTLRRIGANALKNNVYVKYMHIPEGVTYIGDSAFVRNLYVRGLNIPKDIEYVGNCAYAGSWYNDIDFRNFSQYDKLRHIGDNAFSGISRSVYGRKLVFPANVKYIGNLPFDPADNVREIVFKGEVDTIGTRVVGRGNYGAPQPLNRVVMVNTTPPYIQEETFTMTDTGVICIPCGTEPDYTTAPYWRDYPHYEEDCPPEEPPVTAITSLADDGLQITTQGRILTLVHPTGTTATVYDIMGRTLWHGTLPTGGHQEIPLPTAGTYIVRTHTTIHKVVVY